MKTIHINCKGSIKNCILIIFFYFLISLQLFAQSLDLISLSLEDKTSEPNKTNLYIPDILGYKTFKCDFHLHTVFSDGAVWPTVRVNEAVRDGLDVIAITDHLPGRKNKEYISGDHNSSYDIALPSAKSKGITLIKGAELTFSAKNGHYNALFITDANAIADSVSIFKCIDVAVSQGAFITWNHPCWRLSKNDVNPEIQGKLISEGKINGVEVFNSNNIYPLGLYLCANENFVFMSGSDAHNPIQKTEGQFSRPLTLVFAENKSEAAIKKALFGGRTLVLSHNIFAGRESYLRAMFDACIKLSFSSGKCIITNASDIPFKLQINEESSEMNVKEKASVTYKIKGDKKKLHIKVLNMLVNNDKYLVFTEESIL